MKLFIDLWIFGIFAALFGLYAILNWNIGYRKGICDTISQMLDDDIISVKNNKIVPYEKGK